ncbi:MAG: ABC transporter ATP-binding protein [Candidatus Heimdallarchaeota archaeon]|nr:ABC transporter ATP-binding protein [Candidatus Heimdallarchaeota archaeon]MBY8993062.1 ABC transporter ATP-binding protein [Candidatus Heimdallarchaeota archaeon]
MGSHKEILYIDGITKIFGKAGSAHSVVALNNISFSLTPGANSILGPNGAGKSTLIKILLGYLRANNGSAQVLGYDIFKEGKKIREIVGYMPEHHTLIPGVNAIKQVSLLGRISGLPKSEAMQRAHETLQYVGLDEARYRKVDEFSSGMLQRLKLAQSLVNDPELLILDEPTNGLDPKGRLDMIALIREISQDHAINIIVSSHLLPDVEATCDYATILNYGKVVAQGGILELTGLEAKSQEQRIMNVRIKGNMNDFLVGLKDNGLTFKVEDKIIQIPFLKDDISRKILEIAFETKVQIRSISPRKTILEDVFVHKIEDVKDASVETGFVQESGSQTNINIAELKKLIPFVDPEKEKGPLVKIEDRFVRKKDFDKAVKTIQKNMKKKQGESEK